MSGMKEIRESLLISLAVFEPVDPIETTAVPDPGRKARGRGA